MNLEHGGDIYAVAAAREWDWTEIIDFSASINPLGPSPSVATAIGHAVPRIVHYPERYAPSLRSRLSRLWDVAPERILAGNGATELIHFFARTWPAEKVALRIPAFSEFHRAFPNATLVETEHVDGFDLVIATNPNNPTGEALSSNANFIDESFLEFTGLPTALHDEDKFVLRSLTKFQALPGLRAGALVGPRTAIGEMMRRREPWQVNVLAEAAAIAAIEDTGHARRTIEYVSRERERLWPLLSSLAGVHALRTHANYYFARLDYSASRLCDWLLERKILIRNCTGLPGIEGQAIRIAIRTREQNNRLLDLWSAYRAAAP